MIAVHALRKTGLVIFFFILFQFLGPRLVLAQDADFRSMSGDRDVRTLRSLWAKSTAICGEQRDGYFESYGYRFKYQDACNVRENAEKRLSELGYSFGCSNANQDTPRYWRNDCMQSKSTIGENIGHNEFVTTCVWFIKSDQNQGQSLTRFKSADDLCKCALNQARMMERQVHFPLIDAYVWVMKNVGEAGDPLALLIMPDRFGSSGDRQADMYAIGSLGAIVLACAF